MLLNAVSWLEPSEEEEEEKETGKTFYLELMRSAEALMATTIKGFLKCRQGSHEFMVPSFLSKYLGILPYLNI